MSTTTMPNDTNVAETAHPSGPSRGIRSLQEPTVRRRRVWWAILALAAIGFAAATLVAGDSVPHTTHTASPLLDPAIRGVYQFTSGEEMTLLGSEHRPTYEMGATLVGIADDGSDGFTARDDANERIELQRANGRVTGLVHHRADGTSEHAMRVHAYTEQEVTFSSNGADLSGTLLKPTTAGPHPGVIIAHGAERATRDTYRLLATHYARRGVAALIYDKRGLGESTGDVANATFDDLTDDVLAGARALRADPDIDRVGVAGFSQGGWLAGLAAERDPHLAFVVTYSASGFSPADQNAWLYGNMLATRGFNPQTIAIAERAVRMLYSTVDLVDAGVMPAMPRVPGFWFHALDLHLDTAAIWERVDQPVLGIWGANDCQVPAQDSARAVAEALHRGGNTDHTLVVIADADHGLTITGPCEHELGIHHHSRVRYAADYLERGADWIINLEQRPGSSRLDIPAPTSSGVLDWHQGPPAPAPWHMTAALQAPLMVLLPLAFVIAGSAALIRRRRRHTTRDIDHIAARAATAVIVAGFATVVLGTTALVELATLGGLHSRLLVGDGLVRGTTPLLIGGSLSAIATAIATTILTVRLVRLTRTANPPSTPRLHWATAVLGTTASAWAFTWDLALAALSPFT